MNMFSTKDIYRLFFLKWVSDSDLSYEDFRNFDKLTEAKEKQAEKILNSVLFDYIKEIAYQLDESKVKITSKYFNFKKKHYFYIFNLTLLFRSSMIT